MTPKLSFKSILGHNSRILFIVKTWAIFSLMLISSQYAKASHAMGADLSYKCLGGNTYEITLKFYRDCAGVSAPTSASITLSSALCAVSTSMNLALIPAESGIEVSPLCPSQIVYSSCHNGPLPGVQIYTYRDTFVFPKQCSDWIIGWTHCCRNASITNLQSPSSQSMYIEATLDNTNGLCNSSPVFTSLPVPFICANQLFNYNHGVVEPDGDSLFFSMVSPMTTGGLPIAHNVGAGYSLLNPILSSSPFTFSNITGQFTFTANGLQVCVVSIKVEEFRNGVLIGSTMRDIQIVIINCTNDIPFTNNIQNFQGGGVLVDSMSIKVCPGENINFDVIGQDINTLDSVYMATNFTSVFTGATFSSTGKNPITGHFNWTPGINDTGFHFFTVNVKDNSCPIVGSQSYAFSILVTKKISVSPDVKYCISGGPQKLKAIGGSHFSWTPKTGIVGASADSSWIMVAPLITTSYQVISNCNATDSVLVTVVPGFNHTISANDTICKFDQSQINVSADPLFSPYIWIWTPADSLSTPNGPNPMSSPLKTTTYEIEITSKDGCVVHDSTRIVVQGEIPRIEVKAVDSFLCPDDQLQLNLFASPGECGPNLNGCNNNPKSFQLGSGFSATGLPTPFEGAFEDARMQLLFRATELHAAGIDGGTITSLSLEVANKMSSLPFNNFSISMGCTNIDTMPKKFQSGLYNVFYPKTILTSNGWNNFSLDLGYDWDGFSNLLVEICFDNAAWSDDDDVTFSPTTYNSVLYDFFDNTLGCSLINPTQSTDRPNIKMEVCSKDLNGLTVSWTPATGLSDPNIADPIVSNITAPITYTIVADNNGCMGITEFTIYVDTTVLSTSNDTVLCDPIAVQLSALATGNPPFMTLFCGANGTPATGSPTSYELGGGTTSSAASIFAGNVEDMQYQILYTAQELQSLGISSGVIKEYAIELASKNSTTDVNNFNIYMGCTTASTLNISSWESTPDLVLSSNTYSTNTSWNNFVLTNPFDWDGTSNIVVQICWDNPNGSPMNSTDNLMTHPTSFNSMIRNYGNGQSGCNFPTPQFIYNQRVNTRFTLLSPPPGNFAYSWSPGYSLNDSTIANPIATPITTTTYTVSTTTASGCVINKTVTIYVSNNQAYVSNDTAICFGDTASLQASGGITYLWQPSNGLSDQTIANPLANPSVTTTYTVTITDVNGCSDILTSTVTVNPLPVIDAGAADTIFIGQHATLHGTGAINYVWKPGTDLDNPTVSDPVATPVQTTLFTLTGTDINGCRESDTTIIVVLSDQLIIAPTAFSPNGDGLNDLYLPTITGALILKDFSIFNRWGEKIFSTDNASLGWNGSFNGSKQEIGTYIYIIHAENYLGESIIEKGNLTLIR